MPGERAGRPGTAGLASRPCSSPGASPPSPSSPPRRSSPSRLAAALRRRRIWTPRWRRPPVRRPSSPSATARPPGRVRATTSPGTRGEGGDWCHRSPHAYIHAARLAPTDRWTWPARARDAADVARAAAASYGEAVAGAAARRRGPAGTASRPWCCRSGQRRRRARRHRRSPASGRSSTGGAPRCRETVGPPWPAADGGDGAEGRGGGGRRAGGDARRRATPTATTRLVLASYAAPVTERMIALHAAQGCPYSRADAAVGAHGAVPGAVATRCAGWPRDAGARVPRPVRGRPRAARRAAGCSPRGVAAAASPSTRTRWSTAGSTRSASTSPRSRSTRRPPRTRRWAAARGVPAGGRPDAACRWGRRAPARGARGSRRGRLTPARRPCACRGRAVTVRRAVQLPPPVHTVRQCTTTRDRMAGQLG